VKPRAAGCKRRPAALSNVPPTTDQNEQLGGSVAMIFNAAPGGAK
jgi:hypothetical protein